MKLSHLSPAPQRTVGRRNTSSIELSELDIWDEAGVQPVSVRVEYEVEPASYSYHPYGEGEAREEHPAEVAIISVTSLHDVEVWGDNEVVIKTLLAGTDLKKEDFYTTKNEVYLEDQVLEMLGY